MNLTPRVESDACGCRHTHGDAEWEGRSYGMSFGLIGYPAAMVYAPIQHFDHIFDLDIALSKGTIFEELDLPFECGRKTKGGCCNG